MASDWPKREGRRPRTNTLSSGDAGHRLARGRKNRNAGLLLPAERRGFPVGASRCVAIRCTAELVAERQEVRDDIQTSLQGGLSLDHDLDRHVAPARRPGRTPTTSCRSPSPPFPADGPAGDPSFDGLSPAGALGYRPRRPAGAACGLLRAYPLARPFPFALGDDAALTDPERAEPGRAKGALPLLSSSASALGAESSRKSSAIRRMPYSV